MHINWPALGNYLYGNRVAIISGVGLIVSSGVKSLPIPGRKFSTYEFVYDWSHQFLNITNTRLNTQPTITPPETAVSPK